MQGSMTSLLVADALLMPVWLWCRSHRHRHCKVLMFVGWQCTNEVQGASEVGFGWLPCKLLILKMLLGLQIRLDQFDSGSRLQKF